MSGELGLRDAYTHLAPMVDTDVYMRWLLGEVRKAGCRIVELKISEPLATCAESLARQFEVDAIVNCAGLGAGELYRRLDVSSSRCTDPHPE